MTKVLYVRGFDDKLHEKLDDQVREEGIPAASILENAFEEWFKNKQSAPTRHFLVLYADDESLENFLKKVTDLNEDDWFNVTLGPESHAGVKYLKKHGWYDATLSPYAQGIKNPEKYSAKVFDNVRKVSANKQTCVIGFMTEDIAHHHSVEKATKIEGMYDSNKVGGVMFCPYDMRKISNFNLINMFEIFEKHERTFVLKNNEINELNVNKINCAKLFL